MLFDIVKISYLVFFFLFFTCCRSPESQVSEDEIKVNLAQIEIKKGRKFYLLHFLNEKELQITKGRTEPRKLDDSEPLRIEYSDTSPIFKLDSVGNLFNLLEELRQDPQLIGRAYIRDEKVEIYYKGELVYLERGPYREEFWRIVKPIIKQIPVEWNPFLVKVK